jgi:hypothetical protein
MIGIWLALPLPALLAILVLFFCTSAILLVWLSFGRTTGPAVQSFRGVVAPFIGAVAVVLAILIGFLANDIWDRDRRAAAAVRTEADQLLALNTLAATFNLPRDSLAAAIRAYASTVVKMEWPSMAHQQSSPEAEVALDQISKAIDGLHLSAGGRGDLDRLMFDTALTLRTARNTRLALSQDQSENVKWLSVLALAVMSQVSVALVHLERARAQIAAITVLTVSLVMIIGLLAAHESPFAPPLAISPAPIIHVLDAVPAG